MKPFNHSEDTVKKLLQEAAEQIKPNAAFTANLEKQLKQTHRPKAGFNMLTLKKITSPIGWGLALIALALAFNWIASQIAPKTVPGSNGPTEEPAPFSEDGTPVSTISTPAGQVYEWNRQPVYLNTTLPEAPAEMKIYLAKNEVAATVEDAQTLAGRFGMQGEIYPVAGEMADTTEYLVVDGNQQLRVRSDRYFTYYPDYAASQYLFNTHESPEQKPLIDEFMQRHGLGSEYKIEFSELYNGYFVLPLTADGFPVHHESFATNGYIFEFNGNGILRVRSSLLRYDEVATVGVISAQEAFDRLLDPASIYGVLSGSHSPNPTALSWRRTYPVDETFTYYGFLSSTARSVTGGAPLILLDGYPVIGNVQDIPEDMPNTYVEATGQFHQDAAVRAFDLQTWKTYGGYEEGHQGSLQEQAGEILFLTTEGITLKIQDLPADLPLPMENVFITGITQGGEYEWKSIDTRSMSGGGGGGGGLGFYTINLSGTPVPLPTPIPQITPTLARHRFEKQRGMIGIVITNQTDGSQSAEYWFSSSDVDYPYVLLEGENLEDLQDHNNRPVEIWGVVDHYDKAGNIVVRVEQFEIPFPDLEFQILKGMEETVEVGGNSALLFTAENGQSYVHLSTNCHDIVGPEMMVGTAENGEQILIEALIVPDVTVGGYPTVCVFAISAAANNPDGALNEMTITADQPYVVDGSIFSPTNPPTLSIEIVELVYFTPDRRYYPSSEGASEPPYLQPVWIFRGHYNDGSEFEFIVQALKDEYLSPQTEAARPPG